MPYRMFCDRCECEVSINYVSSRAIIELDGWEARVMLRNPEHVWNKGILCEDCLRQLLREGSLHAKERGE